MKSLRPAIAPYLKPSSVRPPPLTSDLHRMRAKFDKASLLQNRGDNVPFVFRSLKTTQTGYEDGTENY
jgi:hypothetical protein